MGQEISAIVTSQNVEVDSKFVHFKEKDAVVIPLDISSFAIKFLVDKAAGYVTVSDFVRFLTSLEDYYEDAEHQHSIKTVIELIETLHLNDFFMEYHCEWAGLDAEQCFIAVKSGKIIMESKMEAYEHFDYDKYDRHKKELSISSTWWSNESRYYFYSTALEVYQERQGKTQ